MSNIWVVVADSSRARIFSAEKPASQLVEIETLAHHPGLGFFGEESDQSPNTKYFNTTADTVVHLDPINSTFLYKHQRSGWDIILSIRDAGRLVAAISYMPARERFYLAVDGIGALTGQKTVRTLGEFDPLRTRAGSRLCLTYRTPGIKAKLAPEYICFDIVEEDDPQRGVDNLNDLFTGKLDAFACSRAALLDWGATAFIAAASGGCASHLDGTAFTAFDHYDPEHHTDMLVTANPDVHRRILDLLNGSN